MSHTIYQPKLRHKTKAKKLIHHYLKKHNREPNTNQIKNLPLWDADFFGLDVVDYFQNLADQAQIKLLEQCSFDLLAESYFIENTGITYSAKLTLIAPTLDEKKMFSFIGSDEATHLEWITPYLDIDRIKQDSSNSFVDLIAKVVSLDKANVLYYLVQVILEGWGLKHYKNLSKRCILPSLKHVFHKIVQDEAYHHHTGKTFFSAKALTPTDKTIILDCLKAYCEMIRIGPVSVLNALNQAAGGLSIDQATKVFDQLQSQARSTEKLNILHQLMQQPGMHDMVNQLEHKGYFTPYSNEVCAKLFLAS